MKFVSSSELAKGMRLARPIYNKNGVLLYDRGTKLTKQGINSIVNFKLYGIYILEPVEPVPPMTEDDIEFERFQTMNVYGIRDTWELLMMGRKMPGLDTVTRDIQLKYSSVTKKIDFSQTLRSSEDELYKHSLNTAILCALMATRLRMNDMDQKNLIKAALLFDIGCDTDEIKKEDFPEPEEYYIQTGSRGSRIITASENISKEVKDIVVGRYRLATGNKTIEDSPLSVKILQAAQEYDDMTAMKLDEQPMTGVSAIRKMLSNSKKYGAEIISALVVCLKVLYPGICVGMTDGSSGLVIKSNNDNVLRPVVLLFDDNRVIDLADNTIFKEIQIADIMKQLDKRIHINKELIEEYLRKYNS